MKRFLLGLSAAAVAVTPASAFARSGLEGRWRNGAMQIVVAPCGRSLCGTVVKASDMQRTRAQHGSGTRLLGARLIDNIQPSGPGMWRANIFVADKDMNARGTIQQVNPNRLTVRGCVLAVICKTTHWDRVS